jgi:flavin reductase (DIM6/NTAB) family NADH-FMN oxidoreductase RutF
MGTYNEDDTVNFAPITWVGVTWDKDQHLLVISMFGTKRTKENLARDGMLSANLVSTDMLELLDYFGSCSGKDGQKNAIPFEFEEGRALHVPTLNQSRWVYECKVAKTVRTGDSDTYFCKIKNVQHMEELLDRGGIDLTLLEPVVYSGMYHSVGECLGNIGDFYKAE